MRQLRIVHAIAVAIAGAAVVLDWTGHPHAAVLAITVVIILHAWSLEKLRAYVIGSKL